MSTSIVKTDFLVVGVGPSGATLASCLGENSLLMSQSMKNGNPANFSRAQGNGHRELYEHG
jgi:hypothetical protein